MSDPTPPAASEAEPAPAAQSAAPGPSPDVPGRAAPDEAPTPLAAAAAPGPEAAVEPLPPTPATDPVVNPVVDPVADSAAPVDATQSVPEAVAERTEPTLPSLPVADEAQQQGTAAPSGTESGEAPPEAAAAQGGDAGPAPAPPAPTLAQTAARLAEHFPALFGGPARPIKLRIQADIQARAPGAFGRRELSLFLHRHTTSTAYLKAMVALRQRYDLDGAAAGDVAEEHLAAATAELERRWAIVKARRQEQARGGRPADAKAPPPAASADGLGVGPARRPDGPRGPRPAGGPGRPQRPPRPPHQASAGPTAAVAHATEAPGDFSGRGKPGPQDRPGRGRRDQPPPGAGAQRPPRAAGGDGAARGDSARPRPPRSERPPRPERPPAGAAAAAPPAAAWSPEDQARRERALLLRAFESSPLSKTNFCVLKRISEAELDAALAQARSERAAWQREHPPQPRPAR